MHESPQALPLAADLTATIAFGFALHAFLRAAACFTASHAGWVTAASFVSPLSDASCLEFVLYRSQATLRITMTAHTCEACLSVFEGGEVSVVHWQSRGAQTVFVYSKFWVDEMVRGDICVADVRDGELSQRWTSEAVLRSSTTRA
jgi:hypothetical protein